MTFVEKDMTFRSVPSPTSTLFLLSKKPTPSSTRRRSSKKQSEGHIPRPMNSFMLFRKHFLDQKHVPATIGTNGESLSKIIGNCWRILRPGERRFWEEMAKMEKAEHKVRYPNYRFRPVHKKNKPKKEKKSVTNPEEDRRCEEIAQLLLQGNKGNELTATVHKLDLMRTQTPPTAPIFRQHRHASVPLPSNSYPDFDHDITLPNSNVPSLSHSPPASPLIPISHQQQHMMLGNHRALSALPVAPVHQPCTKPSAHLQRGDSPLPSYNDKQFMYSLLSHHNQNLVGPLDSTPLYAIPFDLTQRQQHMYASSSASPSPDLPELDPLFWLDPQLCPESHPSTAYSGSPPPSDAILAVPAAVSEVQAPQPHLAAAIVAAFEDLDFWRECGSQSFMNNPIQYQQLNGLKLDFDMTRAQKVEPSLASFSFDTSPMGLSCVQEQAFNTLFQSSMFDEGFADPGSYHTDATYIA